MSWMLARRRVGQSVQLQSQAFLSVILCLIACSAVHSVLALTICGLVRWRLCQQHLRGQINIMVNAFRHGGLFSFRRERASQVTPFLNPRNKKSFFSLALFRYKPSDQVDKLPSNISCRRLPTTTKATTTDFTQETVISC